MTGEFLQLGDVIVSEGSRAFWSRHFARQLRSRATHAIVVTGVDEAVEATFPKVRTVCLSERLAELRRAERAYAVLRVDGIDRTVLAHQAKSYVGRWYDVGQLLLYVLLGGFVRDGDGTLVCSRLVTASYWRGAGVNLFPCDRLAHGYPLGHARRGNVADGYATPVDLLAGSVLRIALFHPSPSAPTLDALLGQSRSHPNVHPRPIT